MGHMENEILFFKQQQQRIAGLRERLVRLWLALTGDKKSLFRREETQRLKDPAAWEERRQGLIQTIEAYITEGEPTWETLQSGPSRSMMMSALDRVLAEDGRRKAGVRLEPRLVAIADRHWHLVLRPSPLADTVHLNQRDHPRNHLRHHLIYSNHATDPDVLSIDRLVADRELRADLLSRARTRSNTLNFYLGTFGDAVLPDWNGMPGERCVTDRFTSHADLRAALPLEERQQASATGTRKRRDSLFTLLEEAKELQADVVVFPELSLCPTLRGELAEWLAADSGHSFLLVVAGSFHERIDGADDPVNRSVLLDGHGRALLVHDKIFPFGKNGFCHEIITPGNTVTLLMTPLGIWVLAICRDFLERDGQALVPWQDLAPDWALVPSMTPVQGLAAQRSQAKDLINCCRTRSVVVNQCLVGSFAKNEHGFVYYPRPDGQVARNRPDDPDKGIKIGPGQRLVSIPIPP